MMLHDWGGDSGSSHPLRPCYSQEIKLSTQRTRAGEEGEGDAAENNPAHGLDKDKSKLISQVRIRPRWL